MEKILHRKKIIWGSNYVWKKIIRRGNYMRNEQYWRGNNIKKRHIQGEHYIERKN